MESLGGYEVEVIEPTNIDHTLRRAERVKADIAPEAKSDLDPSDVRNITDCLTTNDESIEAEEIRIDFDIINDDLDAESGMGSQSFKEDWA